MAKPLQKRAIMTREKILDGLENLLESQEFEKISIAELARAAGVAVGSVYSHFKDKDALLPALLDRQLKNTQERLKEYHETGTIEGILVEDAQLTDLRSSIALSVRAALMQVNQSLGVRRALLTYRRLNPDIDIPLAKTLSEQALQAMVEQFEQYRSQIAHEDLTKAARMVNYFVNILFLERIVIVNSPIQQSLRPDDEELIETYTEMIYHYLTKG